MDQLSCLTLFILLLYFSKKITHILKSVPGMYFKSAAKERETPKWKYDALKESFSLLRLPLY